MNNRLFYWSLATTFAMLFWLVFQPTENDTFIAIRIIIAFISAIFIFLSVTWNEPNGWRRTMLALLAILGGGTIGYIGFSWGFTQNPGITAITLVLLLISVLLWIAIVQPMMIRKKYEKMEDAETAG